MESFVNQGIAISFFLVALVGLVLFVGRYQFWKNQTLILALFFPVGLLFTTGLVLALMYDVAPYFSLMRGIQSIFFFTLTVVLSLCVRWLYGDKIPQLQRLAWRFPLLAFLAGWALPHQAAVLGSIAFLLVVFLILQKESQRVGQLKRPFLKFFGMYSVSMCFYLFEVKWWQFPLLLGTIYLFIFFMQFCSGVYLRGIKS